MMYCAVKVVTLSDARSRNETYPFCFIIRIDFFSRDLSFWQTNANSRKLILLYLASNIMMGLNREIYGDIRKLVTFPEQFVYSQTRRTSQHARVMYTPLCCDYIKKYSRPIRFFVFLSADKHHFVGRLRLLH